MARAQRCCLALQGEIHVARAHLELKVARNVGDNKVLLTTLMAKGKRLLKFMLINVTGWGWSPHKRGHGQGQNV